MTEMSGPKLPEPVEGGGSNHVALWAGATALFTNLAAINLIAILGGTDMAPVWVQAVAALITSFFVAGTVYARQRWEDEKARRKKD